MWPFGGRKKETPDPRFNKIISGPTFEELVRSLATEDNRDSVVVGYTSWDGHRWHQQIQPDGYRLKVTSIIAEDDGMGRFYFPTRRFHDKIQKKGHLVYFCGFAVDEDGQHAGNYITALYCPATREGVAEFGFDG